MENITWKIKNFEELSTLEFHQILKARIDIFVVEQSCPYSEIDGFDPQAIHLWAESKEGIVAYCRIFAPGIKYKESSIGRVLTTPNFRGQSFGKILMKVAIASISVRFQTSEIIISAQDYLLLFYKDLGFSPTLETYLEDRIPHTEMIRN
jgi:ElaA protein